MNKVFLIGRLVRDPELRYTSNNTPVATFSLAVNRNFAGPNGERETDFINIVVWRKQAENCKNYINQGSQVAIDGRIQTRNYEDQNGQKRYVTEVVADNVQFLDTKAQRERQQNSNVNPYNVNDSANMNSYNFEPEPSNDVTPYNINTKQEKTMNMSEIPEDPFKDFGEEIKVENDLPF